MYKENPVGEGVIWLAEHNGKIVGHSAAVPIIMKIDCKTVAAFQSIDTMTHPGYRHQGIYVTLAKRVYAEIGKEGMCFGYRFPNENSYPIAVKKLNWFDICRMQMMCKSFNWQNAIKLKVKNKFLRRVLAAGAILVFNKVFFRTQKPHSVEGLNINQVTSFDERFDEFWPKACGQPQIMVIRNKDYLNWRYGNPNANYIIFAADKYGEICGYLVLEHYTQDGVKVSSIFDIIADSEEVMHCLISKAMENCRQNEVDVILYSFIADRIYQQVARRSGFISIPFIKGGHFCAYSSSPSISKEFLSESGNWFVQLGDSDAT